MPTFDIAGRGKMWFIISLLIIIPGLISMATRGFNFGIDFTGGTIIDLKFEKPVGIAQIRETLKPYGLDGATIQLSGESSDVETSTDVMIRTIDLEEIQRKEVMASIREKVGGYEVLREEKVVAIINGELIFKRCHGSSNFVGADNLYVTFRFKISFQYRGGCGLTDAR